MLSWNTIEAMSQYTLFISDLHLQANLPQITRLFQQFIKKETGQADALYILGDLFETWVGDDDQTPFHQSIQETLKQVSDNIPVFFMHGNRDFLIGKHFVEKSGVHMLKEPSLITLYGQSIILCHGDHLCTRDIRHQRYRRIMHQTWLQTLLLKLPLTTRHRIADYLRHKSRGNSSMDNDIMDVTPDAVEQLMRQYASKILIHGHTHRPQIHNLDKNAKRIVLGAWHDDSAKYLRFHSNGQLELASVTTAQRLSRG